MRKLRHPIATFVVMVLAVITIGVGIVAATTNQTVYGPSWGRFTAAFPGRVDVVHSGPVATAADNDPARYLTVNYYANQPFNGWVGYAPLSTAILPPDLRAVSVSTIAGDGPGPGRVSAMRLVADPSGGYLSAPGVSEDERVADGLKVITLGPVCDYGQCDGELVVSNGRVAWDVLAASNGSVSAVESFLDSFQPIG